MYMGRNLVPMEILGFLPPDLGGHGAWVPLNGAPSRPRKNISIFAMFMITFYKNNENNSHVI